MRVRKLVIFGLTIFLLAPLALALAIRSADELPSGKYAGTAWSDYTGTIQLTAQFNNDGGKISGAISTPYENIPIKSGTYTEGKLDLKIDFSTGEGTVTAEYKDGKVTGYWRVPGADGTLELKKSE